MSEHPPLQEMRQWRSHVTDDVLDYIYKYRNEHPWSPDIRDVCAGLGITSTSVVNYHFDRLEEAGMIGFHYIQRKHNKGRHRAARTVHLTQKGLYYAEQRTMKKKVFSPAKDGVEHKLRRIVNP